MTSVRAAASMTEAQLQSAVRRMCADLGLAVEHVENSFAGKTWLPGMPDLTIFGSQRANFARPAVLFRELKSMSGDLSPEQRRVRLLIEGAGGNWALWRPVHLLDGTIARELTAISPLAVAGFTAADMEQYSR